MRTIILLSLACVPVASELPHTVQAQNANSELPVADTELKRLAICRSRFHRNHGHTTIQKTCSY